jgi:hypothetical protein
MDVRLDDVGLERERQRGQDNEEPSRQTDALEVGVSCCGSLHEAGFDNSGEVYGLTVMNPQTREFQHG